MSGYIWAYLKMETSEYDDMRVVIKKKVKRLLVPYLFVSIVWAGPAYCFFYGGISTFMAFILGDNPSQLWFLLALFWMFVLVELMWHLAPVVLRRWQLLLVFALATYILARVLYVLPLDVFQIAHALDYFLCFLIGV